ncbi:MAG: hypothetical protein ACRDEB_06720, partial [Chitinophagaceae bacterium]
FQNYRPDVLESFKKLVATGYVEILAETYYQSFSYLYSTKEFQRQVIKHSALVKEVFNTMPVVFRNTDLLYDNKLSRLIADLGYSGILCEGLQSILYGRTINRLYAAPDNGDFGVLLRNPSLSNDIAFYFNDNNWSEHPLTAKKFAGWLHALPENTEVVNLFFDYETFGVHKKKESGIFDFLQSLPSFVLDNKNFRFSTPTEAIHDYYPRDIYDVPQTISWKGRFEKNNELNGDLLQNKTLKKIYSLENMAIGCNNECVLDTWGRLQASDHLRFYFGEMDGVKKQETLPIVKATTQSFDNILTDFEINLIKVNIEKNKKKARLNLPAFILY